MAADQNISLTEAEERLRWQDHAPDLQTRLRARLGPERFGGMWIDPDDGDRLKVGVVGATAADHTTVASAAAAESVAGVVDLVEVRYSEARLQGAVDWISEQLALVNNKKARWPLLVGPSVRDNRVTLELPRRGKLAWAQQALVGRARSRYGELLQTLGYDQRPVATACVFPYCDPPLRAGIRKNSPVGGTNYVCTAGFLGRSVSDNKLYVFTAGHCPWGGGTSTWWTRFSDFGFRHDLGPAHNGIWDERGDMGIIRITNEAGWRPRAWVVVYSSPDTSRDESYSITLTRGSMVGQRICLTGSVGGTDCGEVTDLGLEVPYCSTSATGARRCETVGGLGRVRDLCPSGGDSGGPMYANHRAFGIQVAAGGCVAYYQGILEAEERMRVKVAHDAG